jgi:hypothetical protein
MRGLKWSEEFQTEATVCVIANDASHQQLGWDLELDFDLIVTLERKIDVERHTAAAYCGSTGRGKGPPPCGTIT